MKLHQKGYLLVELSKVTNIWDQVLIKQVLDEYNLTGAYWENNVRVALDELAAAGLIVRIDHKLETLTGRPTLHFRYQLSDFGRVRMMDTGLLT